MIMFYLVLFFTFFQQSLSAVNIKLLKGTHTILPDSNYAPFRGLIFLEEDIAEQWYRLSPPFQMKTISSVAAEMRKDTELANHMVKIDSSEAAMLAILQETKMTATDNLVMQIFHIAGEAFNATEAPNNPVRQLMPKHIGEICRIIADSRSERYLQQDALYGQALLEQIKTRKKVTPEDTKLSVMQLLEQYKKMVTDKSGAMLPSIFQNYLKTKLVHYLFSLNLTKSSKFVFQKKEFYPFVDALIASLQECDPVNPDCSYANNTTQGILISYMLTKVHDRADLQDYFRGFTRDDHFILPHVQYTNDELQDLSEQKPDLNNIASFADYLCAVIYTNKYMSALPKMVSNLTVEYQGNSFPDCVETMIRNLVNIITYDVANQTLGHMPAGLTVNAQLKTFYAGKYNANPAMVGNKNVHNAWLKLVENQEGCSYNRLVIRGTQKHIEVRSLCDGVIPMDDFDTKLPKKEITIDDKKFIVFEHKIKGKTFWITPTAGDLDCFELMPTLTNVIVLLNRMFNLNLTSAIQSTINKFKGQSFANEALQSNFVQLYFEKMCKKFNWSVPQKIYDQIKLLQNISDQSISISIELPSGELFNIDITDKMHGSISVDEEIEFKDLITADEFFAVDTSLQAAIIASKAINWGEILEHDLSKPMSKAHNFTSNAEKPFEKIDKFISLMNKDDKMRALNNLILYEHDDAYVSILLCSFSTEFDMHYQNGICNAFVYQTDVITPKNLKILNILANIFYDIHEFVNGKAVCALLEKNYEQVWHWVNIGMQSLQDYMRKFVIEFLQYICVSDSLEKQVLLLNKIDLILSWIDKDLQNEYTAQSCAGLLLILVEFDLINKAQAPKALVLLSEIKEVSFDEDLEITQEKINQAKEKLTLLENRPNSNHESDGLSNDQEYEATPPPRLPPVSNF